MILGVIDFHFCKIDLFVKHLNHQEHNKFFALSIFVFWGQRTLVFLYIYFGLFLLWAYELFFFFLLMIIFLVLVYCIHRSGAKDRNIGKDLGSYTVLWDQPLPSTHTPFLLIFSVSFFFFQFSLSISYTSMCLCVAMLNKDPKSKSCHVCYNKPNPSSPWHFLNNTSQETTVQFQSISQFVKFKFSIKNGSLLGFDSYIHCFISDYD